jgi:hypothetical protein
MKVERAVRTHWMLALTVSLILGMLWFPRPVAARDVPFPLSTPWTRSSTGR